MLKELETDFWKKVFDEIGKEKKFTTIKSHFDCNNNPIIDGEFQDSFPAYSRDDVIELYAIKQDGEKFHIMFKLKDERGYLVMGSLDADGKLHYFTISVKKCSSVDDLFLYLSPSIIRKLGFPIKCNCDYPKKTYRTQTKHRSSCSINLDYIEQQEKRIEKGE